MPTLAVYSCIWFFCLMVFNTTFNNISVISWQSLLLMEETGVPGENHWPFSSHWQTLIKQCCIEYTSPWTGFELTTLMVIGTDCTGSCKSNYHMITSMTAPRYNMKSLLQVNIQPTSHQLPYRDADKDCKQQGANLASFHNSSDFDHLWRNNLM
jgi:hypothetical protein